MSKVCASAMPRNRRASCAVESLSVCTADSSSVRPQTNESFRSNERLPRTERKPHERCISGTKAASCPTQFHMTPNQIWDSRSVCPRTFPRSERSEEGKRHACERHACRGVPCLTPPRSTKWGCVWWVERRVDVVEADVVHNEASGVLTRRRCGRRGWRALHRA